MGVVESHCELSKYDADAEKGEDGESESGCGKGEKYKGINKS